MRKTLVAAGVAALLVAAPAAASPTLRMAIVHTVRGCHVWMTAKQLGATATVAVARGTRLELRVNCPMDFDLRQTAGPRLALGPARLQSGTTRTIVLRKPGVYRLVARNVQSSDELGLETLGEDNTLTLTIRVR